MQDVVEIAATAITSGDLEFFSTPDVRNCHPVWRPARRCTNCAYGFISHFDHDATAEEHDVR